jgi:hypothetical protein
MRSDLSEHYCCVQKGMGNYIRVIWTHKLFFSLLVLEGVIIDSRTEPRSRISLLLPGGTAILPEYIWILLRILLSSNSAVLINIITGVSPPHFDFVVYYVLCQC